MCTEMGNQSGTCSHTDDERALTGVWYIPELHLALDTGYRILMLYELWHWREKIQGLFEDYVKGFLKVKQEKSGWPAHCKTREERLVYIDDYQRLQGICLEYDAVEYNPGKRRER